MAILNPSPGRPSMDADGTRAFENSTRAWSDARWPSSIFGILVRWMPGIDGLTMNAEIALCFNERSPVANTSIREAIPPLVIQTFVPLMQNESPPGVAV